MANDVLAAPRYLVGFLAYADSECIIGSPSKSNQGKVIAELAAALGQNHSAVRTMTKSLEKRNLLQIDPHLPQRNPRRTYMLALTVPGKALAERIVAAGFTVESFSNPENRTAINDSLKVLGIAKDLRKTWPLEPLHDFAEMANREDDATDEGDATPPKSLKSARRFTYHHHDPKMVSIVRYLYDHGGKLPENQGDHKETLAKALDIDALRMNDLLRRLALDRVVQREVVRGKTIRLYLITEVDEEVLVEDTDGASEGVVEAEAVNGILGLQHFPHATERDIYCKIIQQLQQHGEMTSARVEVMERLREITAEAEGPILRVLTRAAEIHAVVKTGQRKWVGSLRLGPLYGAASEETTPAPSLVIAPPSTSSAAPAITLPSLLDADGDEDEGNGDLDLTDEELEPEPEFDQDEHRPSEEELAEEDAQELGLSDVPPTAQTPEPEVAPVIPIETPEPPPSTPELELVSEVIADLPDVPDSATVNQLNTRLALELVIALAENRTLRKENEKLRARAGNGGELAS